MNSVHKKKEHQKYFIIIKFFKAIKRKIVKKKKKALIEYRNTEIKTQEIIAPKNFSISENLIETLEFFEKIKNHCSESRKKLVVDMKNIENIKIDALMYLKYLVYETKEIKRKNILLSFKAPKNKEHRDFIHSSGFVTYTKGTKFVDSAKKKISYLHQAEMPEFDKNKNFKIKRGSTLEKETIKNIIDFVREKKNNEKFIFLYKMISELMENTIFHAYYDNKNIEHNDWYIFAEHNHNIFSFVFLDTGLGIPKTVKKKFHDKITFKSDSDLLLSTLKGEQRSQTQEEFRGKGLPFVFKHFNYKTILNLRIISNHSCYNINENSDIEKELQGTLFYWEIHI
ncbi:MAG: hypothetical protein ACRC6K_07970 [Fusobacteriaceae bacterium]